MTELDILGRGDLDGIAALCTRGVVNSPTVAELDDALFGDAQPAVVRGDPSAGIVATVQGPFGAHIRILVVDPAERGKGLGHQLVRAAEADARAAGASSITTGADAPFHLWPGIPSTETALLCLFERHRYTRNETNFDMRVDLAAIPDDPGGYELANPADENEVAAWTQQHWAHWAPEMLKGLRKGNLMLVRGDEGIEAACAFEVNRTGFLGPVAVRPDLRGQGRGRPALLGALHELRRRGRAHTDVCWVGPIPPYAIVGGHVSNLYFVYRRALG